MFFKDFVSVKRQKIKRGASQTYDTPSYYIYSPDDYYTTYYLKCKLSSDQDPVIDSVHVVCWNDSTIIIGRGREKYNWWIIKASSEKLKCCNNDSVIGPVSEHFVKAYMRNAKFNRFVLK